MDELLNFLQHTYKKYAGMGRDKKSIVLEISRDDLQVLIESVIRMGEIWAFQDEIDRLKQQHAEEVENLETQIKAGIDLQTILLNTVEIERNTHKGYRQAVKDILGEDVQ